MVFKYSFRFIMPLLGVAAIAGLSACGDENTTIMTTPQMMEAYEALPECTSDNEGRWVYVKDSAETYYCAENKWLAVSGREGKDGEDGASCMVTPLGDKSGYKVFCGGDSVGVLLNGTAGKNGLNGTNGTSGSDGKDGEDGASCMVTPLGDKSGYKIFCGGDSVGVLLNGVAGKNGLNGTNGTNGNDGENGVTPQLRINAETNYWEVSYDNGATWNSTDVLATGPQGENGTNGTNGSDGENGITPQLRINAETNHWEVSYDNGTTWSDTGVLATGPQGESGSNGTNGNDGENGVTPQLRINAETNYWEVSYDNGATWNSTDVLATGPQGENGTNGTNGSDGENGVTPQLRINTETNHWEVSYDNGATWSDMGVSASGPSEQSSSSVSSSSFAQSSSSTGVAAPCNTEAGNNCVYGTLTDSRDGQTYRTITIGSQTWMAQNLNYRYIQQTDGGAEADSSSYCLGDDGTGDRGAANCAAYGRLYLWSAAMDSVARFSETGKGCGYCPVSGDGSDCLETYKCNENGDTVRGACPAGWHLPSREEFETLIATVGGEDVAGLMLKAQYSWNDNSTTGESGNGVDAYGFSALSVGELMLEWTGYSYHSPGTWTYFWSTSEYLSSTAEFLWLTSSENARVHYIVGQKYHGYPVRCVKN